MTVSKFYSSLGNMTAEEKDSLLKELFLYIAECPLPYQENFLDKWEEWRVGLDIKLLGNSFGLIMKMLEELHRLRYIQVELEKIKEPLLKFGQARLLIGSEEYPADFLFSCLLLLKDSDV